MKKEHFWEYMGVDTETNDEYGYCDLCKQWRKNGETKITKTEYKKRYDSGKVVFK